MHNAPFVDACKLQPVLALDLSAGALQLASIRVRKLCVADDGGRAGIFFHQAQQLFNIPSKEFPRLFDRRSHPSGELASELVEVLATRQLRRHRGI